MKRMKIATKLTALLLAFFLTACTAPSGTDASPGGTGTDSKSVFPGTVGADMVTLNVTSEPSDLNPMRMRDTISQSVLYHCMSGLTRLNEKDEPVADVAERWEMNTDKTVYTMYLRKDAKWSNGDPVTAQDFYYSWTMQMTPSTGAVFAPYLYNHIQNGEAFYNGTVDASELGIKVLDEYTLEIHWSHPMTNGLFYLAQPFYLPMNQKGYEQIGEQAYAKEADQMVTNGPYQIAEWVHDDHITMEKFSDYHAADTIKVPKVKLTMIGDANTALNAFTTGEIDMCGLFSEQIDLVANQDEGAVQSYIDGGSWFLNFNLQNEYLSNLNLRKALACSIDVQSLLDYVINDGSVAADGLVPGIITGADGKPYAEARGGLFHYDKEAANRYLDQALTELGLDKVELNLTFWGTNTTYNKNQAAYLQQQWKENLGLEVTLKAVPNNALSEAEENGEYSFAVGGWGPSENDAVTYLENYRTGDANNTGGYANPEYDRLLKDSLRESDSLKRQAMLIQAEKLLIEDMVVGPLYFTCTKYAVSDKLTGLVRTPFQYFNVCYASIQA